MKSVQLRLLLFHMRQVSLKLWFSLANRNILDDLNRNVQKEKASGWMFDCTVFPLSAERRRCADSSACQTQIEVWFL